MPVRRMADVVPISIVLFRIRRWRLSRGSLVFSNNAFVTVNRRFAGAECAKRQINF